MTAREHLAELKPYGIQPREVRLAEAVRQGHLPYSPVDGFARHPPSEPEHPEQVNNGGGLRASATRNTGESVPGCESAETPATTGFVPGVPGWTGEPLPVEPPPKPKEEISP